MIKFESYILPMLEDEYDKYDHVFIEASGAKIPNPDKIILVSTSKEALKNRYKKHLSHLPEEYVDSLLDK
jgi:hypothetical protein